MRAVGIVAAIALALLPVSAWAQPGPGPGAGCPRNASTCTVIATGGTTARTLAARFGAVVNVLDYGVAAATADNATALQAAINAAVAANVPINIPSAGSGCYKYTAPLTVSGNLGIVGDYLAGNWNGDINVPSGSPALLGSVLCPTSNGSDAIDISGTSLTVNIQDVGFLFQAPFSGTGDGIHYVPTSVQGLSGSIWKNVMVYGHDGSHFAYNLKNFIYNDFAHAFSFGGGGWNLYGTGGVSGNFGNSHWYGTNVQVVVGGSAGGIVMAAGALNGLNILDFISPQIGMVNEPGVTPGGNPPTGAQLAWSMDANETFINVQQPSVGGNISGITSVVNTAANQNFFDFTHGGWVGAIQAPAWTISGIIWPSGNRVTVQDTTSSGTVAIQGGSAIPAITISAASATTYTHSAALYVPQCPTASTNVTQTGCHSLYAAGEIYTATDITAKTGAFISGGTIQLNHNSNFATQIGDGTSNLDVTIGGGSNRVLIGSVIRLPTFTVATLPTCNATNDGTMARVTDATAPTYNAALTGGGAIEVPVFCNGSAWSSH